MSVKRHQEIDQETFNLDQDFKVVWDDYSHIKLLKLHKPKAPPRHKRQVFHLSVYLPKPQILRKNKKIERCIIMVNGLNEHETFHSTLYDQLGANFAKRGIASILLPTPNHLNRYDGEKNNNTPLENLFDKPELIYHNTKKSYREILELKNKIIGIAGTEADKDFYTCAFNGEKTKVSLLGYSLGGLRVLSSFIGSLQKKDKKKDFDGCVLINSGFRLRELSLENLKVRSSFYSAMVGSAVKQNNEPTVKIDSRVWLEYLKILREKIDNERITSQPFFKNIFAPIFIGELWEDDRWTKLDRDLFKSILLIVGGNDDVVRSLRERDSKNFLHKATIFQIPELSHFPSIDPIWINWVNLTTDLIIEFLDNIDNVLTPQSEVLARLEKLDDKYKLFLNNEDVNNSNLQMIAKKIKGKKNKSVEEKSEFYSLVLAGLCYFKDLNALVEKIKSKRDKKANEEKGKIRKPGKPTLDTKRKTRKPGKPTLDTKRKPRKSTRSK